MSNERDSLWVVAVIAVAVLVIPVAMIGFPAEEEKNVTITLDTSGVKLEDKAAFNQHMIDDGWKIAGTNAISKEYGKESNAYNMVYDVDMSVSTASGGYNVPDMTYVGASSMTAAEYVEKHGSNFTVSSI